MLGCMQEENAQRKARNRKPENKRPIRERNWEMNLS